MEAQWQPITSVITDLFFALRRRGAATNSPPCDMLRSMRNDVTPDATGEPCGLAQACAACQGMFVCGIAQGQEQCWCMKLPAVLPVSSHQTCLCEICLTREIARAQRAQEQFNHGS